jgi:hypothetical protein
MMYKVLILTVILFISLFSYCQNVGIGTNNPDNSALLELNSNSKGLLIPRMTKAEKNNINNAATGLMIYQTGPDSVGFHFYNGSQWNWINTSSGGGGSVPSSAVVLSETANNSSLTAGGFSYLGQLRLTGSSIEKSVPVAAQSWLATNIYTNVPNRAQGHLATFNDSVFYVWGGLTASSGGTGAIFKYNPNTDTWTNMGVGGGTNAVDFGSGVKVGNRWIVWGGVFFPGNTPPAFVYNFNTNTLTNSVGAPIPTGQGRAGMGTTVVDSLAFFFGGYDVNTPSVTYNQGLLYNPNSNTWQTITTTGAPTNRIFPGVVYTGSKIVVWGGNASTLSAVGGIYDITTGTWTPMSTTNAPTLVSVEPIMVWRAPYVYVISGNQTKRFDPNTNTWSDLSPTPVSFNGQKFDYDATTGKIYIWGGRRLYFSPSPVNAGYVYDIVNDFYTTLPAANAPQARGGHTVTFGNNHLLIWGGTTRTFSGTPDPSELLNSGGRFFFNSGNTINNEPGGSWYLFKKN